jgi:alpha-beta hydrolase superfamily lysophospholipase
MTAPSLIALRSPGGPGLAALLWEAPPGRPGVVIVPGLGSRKGNHIDMGAALARSGMAALALDLRGHGDSAGALDGECIDDVHAALDHLAARGHGPLGVRGSSMGGMLALLAADHASVRAVVAICAARPAVLADRVGAEWPRAIDLESAVARADGVARGYWHATGDEAVPWGHSFRLAGLSPQPVRLRIALGGDHRSLQHDPAVIAETAAFLAAHLT